MANTKKDILTLPTTSKQINDYLKQNGIKQVWLSEKIEISDSHLSNIFAERMSLTSDVLQRINTVLGTDFTM